jgi:ribosome-associated protein
MQVTIRTEYIKLDQLLKFAGVCSMGSEAKARILDGEVKFNGEVCLMRGKKVRPGDTVKIDDTIIEVTGETSGGGENTAKKTPGTGVDLAADAARHAVEFVLDAITDA